MSANKSVLALLRRSNAVSSLLCSKNYDRHHQAAALHNDYVTKAATKPDWSRALTEAEKLVGYRKTSATIGSILDDQDVNLAVHLRRLVGTNHPLLAATKKILQGPSNMQAWGLIVLLVSKAAGQIHCNPANVDEEHGIMHRQRTLAEITEMIRVSHIMHQSIINIIKDTYTNEELETMIFGNKISLLAGDFLLGRACHELAELRENTLVELVSSAIKDLSESAFIGRRDKQDNPIPSVPPKDPTGWAVKEWTLRNYLETGSLLGKACKGTLRLAGYNEDVEEHGFLFGKHLALAWQACLDLSPFLSNDRSSEFSVASAPVMFHIEDDPSILIEIDKGLESIQNIDFSKVYSIVYSGRGIELTKELQREHSQRALELISIFNESDARTSLENIIIAMSDL